MTGKVAIHKNWLLSAITIGYLIALTYALLSARPFQLAGPAEKWVESYFDRYVSPVSHLITFFFAGLLCALAFSQTSRRLVLGTLVCYAFATEALQHLVPGRIPDWLDIVQNLVGLSLGTGLGWLLRRHNRTPRAFEARVRSTQA